MEDCKELHDLDVGPGYLRQTNTRFQHPGPMSDTVNAVLGQRVFCQNGVNDGLEVEHIAISTFREGSTYGSHAKLSSKCVAREDCLASTMFADQETMQMPPIRPMPVWEAGAQNVIEAGIRTRTATRTASIAQIETLLDKVDDPVLAELWRQGRRKWDRSDQVEIGNDEYRPSFQYRTRFCPPDDPLPGRRNVPGPPTP